MTKQRIVWIDWARFLAIIFVVFCHSIEVEYFDVRFGNADVGFGTWLFQNVVFTIGRVGVPFFLMITGTLMLGRQHCVKEHYVKTVLPLLLTTEIWIVLNFIFVNWSKGIDIKLLIAQMLFLKSPEMSHMWYMPMILGFYLVIPYLAKIIKDSTIKQISVPLLVAIIAFFCIPTYNAFAGEVIEKLPSVSTVIDISFLGGVYGVYMVLGFYIGQKKLLEKVPAWVLIMVVILSFCANTVCAHNFLQNRLFHTDIFGWYDSPFVLASSVALFEMVRRICKHEVAFIGYVARTSFGIYLLHNFFIYFVTYLESGLCNYIQMNIFFKFAIRFIFAFGLSLIACGFVNWIPGKRIKKTLLFIK